MRKKWVVILLLGAVGGVLYALREVAVRLGTLEAAGVLFALIILYVSGRILVEAKRVDG